MTLDLPLRKQIQAKNVYLFTLVWKKLKKQPFYEYLEKTALSTNTK